MYGKLNPAIVASEAHSTRDLCGSRAPAPGLCIRPQGIFLLFRSGSRERLDFTGNNEAASLIDNSAAFEHRLASTARQVSIVSQFTKPEPDAKCNTAF